MCSMTLCPVPNETVELLRGWIPVRSAPVGQEDDTVLYLRQLYLQHRAAQARKARTTLFAIEQPEDPEEYIRDDEKSVQRYVSYWCWPEWKAFRERWGMLEVSFDQGPMGHQRRKPTRLGTNIAKLAELQDIRGQGVGGGAMLAEDLTERIRQSRDWSAWAPGLKMALATAIRSHLPYSRECKSCVIAASRARAQADPAPGRLYAVHRHRRTVRAGGGPTRERPLFARGRLSGPGDEGGPVPDPYP